MMQRFLQSLKMPEGESERVALVFDRNYNQWTKVPVLSNYDSSDVYVDVNGCKTNVNSNGNRLSSLQDFTVKSARNSANNRPVSITNVMVNISLIGIAYAMTYARLPVYVQAVMYLSSFAFMIATDPFNVMSRFMAFQSRMIGAILLSIIAIGLVVKDDNYWTIASVVCACGVVLVLVANKSWIMAENWKMSKAVERAMQNDPDNKASRSWQAIGRRESITMLHELGCTIKEQEIDYIIKACYMLGYIHGYVKTTKQKQRVEKLETELENAHDELEGLKYVQDDLQEMQEAFNTEKLSRKEAEAQVDMLRGQIKSLKEEHKRMSDEYERQSYLLQPDDAIATREEKKESDEDKIIRLHNGGMSYRKIGELMGMSHTKVQNICKGAT